MPPAAKAIRPVQKRSAELQTAESLRDGITTGAILPGTRLTEIKLAAQLGISRATVRTALHQLSQEGLIVQVPYTGWTVMSLTAHDAWELYTLRSSLEALAARLTAERLKSDADRGAEMRRAVAKAFDGLVASCRKGRKLDIADADFALHKTIIGLAGHRRLAEQYRMVEQQIRIYIASSDALVHQGAAIIDQHRPIIEAIAAGDASRAAALSIAHNEEEGRILEAFLRAQEPLDPRRSGE